MRPGSVFGFVLFLLFLSARIFFIPAESAMGTNSPAEEWLFDHWATATGLKVLMFVLVLWISWQAIKVSNRYRMNGEYMVMPGVAFVLLVSFSFTYLAWTPGMIAAALLAFYPGLLFRIKTQERADSMLFYLGLLAGLASVVYLPLASFLLLAWANMLFFRAFSVREYLLTLAGLAVPYLLLATALFWFDKLEPVLAGYGAWNISLLSWPQNNLPLEVTAIVLTLLFVSGALHYVTTFRHKLLDTRGHYASLLWIILFALALMYLDTERAAWLSWLAAVPASFFLADFWANSRKKKLAGIVFWLTVTAALFCQYHTFVFNN